MTSLCKLLAGAVLVAGMGLGCSAEPPGSLPPRPPDGGADVDPNGGTVEPPELGPIPQETYWGTVKVYGTGPARGTVLIDSDQAGSFLGNLQSTGGFCVDVPLRPETVNTLVIRVQDQAGNISDPVQKQVHQHGQPPPQPMPEGAHNAAIGGGASTNLYNSDGSTGDLIDGNPDTRLAGWYWEWSDTYMWVMLARPSIISMAKIFSSADCLTQMYSVLVSNKQAPSEPSETSQDWIRVADVQSGTGSDSLTFQPISAQHIAVFFKDAGCSGYGLQKHRLTEIQAWTQPDSVPPTEQPATCNGN